MASSFEALQECSICTTKYGEPQILPCHHTFCKSCIIQLCKQSNPTCPNCRKQFERNSVKDDFRLKQIFDLIKEKGGDSGEESSTIKIRSHCEFCEESAITHICTDCKQGICRRCGELHLRAKCSRKHTVKSIEDMWKTLKPNYEDILDKLNRRIDKMEEIACKAEIRKTWLHSIHEKTLSELNFMRRCFLRIVNDIFDQEEKKFHILICTELENYDYCIEGKRRLTEENLKLESDMRNDKPKLVLNYINFCEYYKGLAGLPVTNTLPKEKMVVIEACKEVIDRTKMVNVSLVDDDFQLSCQTSTVQKVIRCTLKIFLRMPEKQPLSVDVVPWLPVRQLKALGANKGKLDSTHSLHLTYGGKSMKDSCIVADYNIQNHDTICCRIVVCRQKDRTPCDVVHRTLQKDGFY